MHYRLILACAVTIPVVLRAQPKSAIEFYDTTGANATARFGWRGSQAAGEFYVQTPVGSDAVTVRQGDMAVAGDVSATGTVTASGFAGDGSALTNLPEPQGLQAKLDAKADTSHTHQLNEVSGLQQKLNGKADTSHTHALSEIAPGGISGSDIATGAVTTSHLRDSAVTGSKIRDGSITDADVSAAARIAGSKIEPTFGNDSSFKFITSGGMNYRVMHMYNRNGSGTRQPPYVLGVNNEALVIGWGENPYGTDGEEVAKFVASKALDVANLQMPGSAYIAKGITTNNGVCCSSDRRLKCDIASIDDATEILEKLRGVRFRWDRETHPERDLPEDAQIGLIAQEVEEVLPELVKTNHDGYKGVMYDKLVAVLVEAVKDQQRMIDDLRDQVGELQSQHPTKDKHGLARAISPTTHK